MKKYSTEWLANLEEYDCARCNSKTIFIRGLCSDCDTQDYNLERIKELEAEVIRYRSDIADMNKIMLDKQDELVELEKSIKLK